MSRKEKKKVRGRFHIALPATSANLGPAFDAAAVALNLYIEIDAQPSRNFMIAASGRDREICQNVKNNLILTTYEEILRGNGAEAFPLTLRIKNNIPIGRGCGSSAAARLAGIALACHFGGLGWGDEQVIAEAARREHHADNASACWLGGLCVAAMSGGGAVRAVTLRPKGKWPLLLAIPEEKLSTEQARQVLPAQYPRADTVVNIQNSMLLLAALTEGRHDLLGAALEDRVHQPYRASLCSLLPCVRDWEGGAGILGAALSGSGPSVLIFLDPRVSGAEIRKSLKTHLSKKGLKAELLATSISLVGATG